MFTVINTHSKQITDSYLFHMSVQTTCVHVSPMRIASFLPVWAASKQSELVDRVGLIMLAHFVFIASLLNSRSPHEFVWISFFHIVSFITEDHVLHTKMRSSHCLCKPYGYKSYLHRSTSSELFCVIATLILTGALRCKALFEWKWKSQTKRHNNNISVNNKPTLTKQKTQQLKNI